MPAPVTRTTLRHFCLIFPGIPEGGYNHRTCFTDEEGESDTSGVCLTHPEAGAEQMWYLLVVLICIPRVAGQVKELSTCFRTPREPVL